MAEKPHHAEAVIKIKEKSKSSKPSFIEFVIIRNRRKVKQKQYAQRMQYQIVLQTFAPNDFEDLPRKRWSIINEERT